MIILDTHQVPVDPQELPVSVVGDNSLPQHVYNAVPCSEDPPSAVVAVPLSSLSLQSYYPQPGSPSQGGI